MQVGGKFFRLTTDLFLSLIDLLLAAAKLGSGLVKVDRSSVYRLRRAIDKALGPGTAQPWS